MNNAWSMEYKNRRVAFSVTKAHASTTSVVSISETGGIGSVFDANVNEVQCYLGSRGDGVPEAFARTLVDILGVQHVLLTLAVRDLNPQFISALLSSIRAHEVK